MPFCPQCGAKLPEHSVQCPVCPQSDRPTEEPPLLPPAMKASSPAVLSVDAKATASFILGLFFWIFPCAIIAVVLGHLSLSEIRQSAGRLGGHGRALAGAILGYIGLSLPVLLIFAAIAVPNVLRAHNAANEASAVIDIRIINTAEVTYQAASDKREYTCDLSALRTFGIEDSQLLAGHRRDYDFVLQNCLAATATSPARYQIVAYPTAPNHSGMRAFCSDESGVIKSDPNGSGAACLSKGNSL